MILTTDEFKYSKSQMEGHIMSLLKVERPVHFQIKFWSFTIILSILQEFLLCSSFSFCIVR